MTWAFEGLGSLFFRTCFRNKALRPPAGFEMDQVGQEFTAWVGLAVLSISSAGRKSASAGVYGRKAVCSNSNCSFGKENLDSHIPKSIVVNSHSRTYQQEDDYSLHATKRRALLLALVRQLQPNLA